jgi:TrmH family RNA methyltransferase
MGSERITSPQNPRLKEWVRLRKDGRARREKGEFLLEGRRLVETALALGRVKLLLFSPKLARRGGRAADETLVASLVERARAAGAEAVELSMAAFRKLADCPSPQGVAAIAEIPRADQGALFRGDALLLVACGVGEPGNLGAMMRTAHAAGATGFCTLPPSADLFHPRAVRGSAGAVLALPSARIGEGEFLERARAAGLRLLAAMPRGGSGFREADYSRPVAIAVGSEAHGVPASVAREATAVTIPMRGGAESLNAAAAAAVLVFEAARRG